MIVLDVALRETEQKHVTLGLQKSLMLKWLRLKSKFQAFALVASLTVIKSFTRLQYLLQSLGLKLFFSNLLKSFFFPQPLWLSKLEPKPTLRRFLDNFSSEVAAHRWSHLQGLWCWRPETHERIDQSHEEGVSVSDHDLKWDNSRPNTGPPDYFYVRNDLLYYLR